MALLFREFLLQPNSKHNLIFLYYNLQFKHSCLTQIGNHLYAFRNRSFTILKASSDCVKVLFLKRLQCSNIDLNFKSVSNEKIEAFDCSV